MAHLGRPPFGAPFAETPYIDFVRAAIVPEQTVNLSEATRNVIPYKEWKTPLAGPHPRFVPLPSDFLLANTKEHVGTPVWPTVSEENQRQKQIAEFALKEAKMRKELEAYNRSLGRSRVYTSSHELERLLADTEDAIEAAAQL